MSKPRVLQTSHNSRKTPNGRMGASPVPQYFGNSGTSKMGSQPHNIFARNSGTPVPQRALGHGPSRAGTARRQAPSGPPSDARLKLMEITKNNEQKSQKYFKRENLNKSGNIKRMMNLSALASPKRRVDMMGSVGIRKSEMSNSILRHCPKPSPSMSQSITERMPPKNIGSNPRDGVRGPIMSQSLLKPSKNVNSAVIHTPKVSKKNMSFLPSYQNKRKENIQTSRNRDCVSPPSKPKKAEAPRQDQTKKVMEQQLTMYKQEMGEMKKDFEFLKKKYFNEKM